MYKYHKVKKVAFIKETLTLIVDGKQYSFPLADISKRLTDASPAGYGIHWPLIDEDLSIDGLIGAKHKEPRTKKSISA